MVDVGPSLTQLSPKLDLPIGVESNVEFSNEVESHNRNNPGDCHCRPTMQHIAGKWFTLLTKPDARAEIADWTPAVQVLRVYRNARIFTVNLGVY